MCIIPVCQPLFLQHIPAAWHASRADSALSRDFWGWMWGWVVYGGPVGRAVWGLVLGFKVLQRGHGGKIGEWGGFVNEPRLGLLVTIGIACLLALFTAVRSPQLFGIQQSVY